MKRQRSRVRGLPGGQGPGGFRSLAAVTAAATVALCAVVSPPGQAAAAGRPSPYVFDKGIKAVRGTASTADAPPLRAGESYRDRIAPNGKQYYRLDLDAKTNTYVSAVAVPKIGPKVEYGDDLKVSVLDRGSSSCDPGDTVGFGSAAYARPVSTYAARLIEPGAANCQTVGTYYVLVERSTKATSAPEDWDLELRVQSEPGLKAAGATAAPEIWPSTSPAPPAGGPRKRHGGTGFNDATGLTTGEWRDEIRPGESLFYRVPVDWGQQIFSDIDLHSSAGAKGEFVGGALSVSLFNPARGFVQGAGSLMYDGSQRAASMDPLPPVAYENRFNTRAGHGDMQLAGWYYLRVTLSPEVGTSFGNKPYGTTLRVTVRGAKQRGPTYAGDAGDFSVSANDQEAAASGRSVPRTEKDNTMKVVAAAGLGTGTALVLGLGVWTLVARRGAAAEGPPQVTAPQQGYGPPPSVW